LKPGKRGLSGGGVVYIRDIAKNLYELKNRLEVLEQSYNSEPPGERRNELQLELNRTRQEYKRVKRILEGAKEYP
jgi:uncharacterized protein (DUF3084 family)